MDELVRTSRAVELLRGPGEPRQATFLELFYDLVFILAFVQLSHKLIQDLTWTNAFQTLVLLLAVYWLWTVTAWITDLYSQQRLEIQLLVVATMLGSLVMAAALPEAFGERGPVFAGAYVAIHVGRGLFFVLALRGHELQRRSIRVLFWFGVSAVPWITGAFLPATARGLLWASAVAVDYTAGVLRYPAPRLGRSHTSEWSIVAEHLAERYRQFFIVALGELILVTGLAFSGAGFAPTRTAALVVSFATTVLLWRIYIYRAGELLPAAIRASADPDRLARSAVVAHLLMVAGVVAIAVGDETVVGHPSGHTEPAWVAAILGGPALFLAGRAIFEYAVFARVSRSRLFGVLALAGTAPLMITVSPLVVAAAAALVLAVVAVSDAVRARGRPPEPPSPPR